MKQLVTLTMLVIFPSLLLGQNVKWILKPSIDDVDGIYLKYPNDNLLITLKGEKYGVKDINNRLIINPNYDKIFINEKETIITAKKGDEYFSFDNQGKRIALVREQSKGFNPHYPTIEFEKEIGMVYERLEISRKHYILNERKTS